MGEAIFVVHSPSNVMLQVGALNGQTTVTQIVKLLVAVIGQHFLNAETMRRGQIVEAGKVVRLANCG